METLMTACHIAINLLTGIFAIYIVTTYFKWSNVVIRFALLLLAASSIAISISEVPRIYTEITRANLLKDFCVCFVLGYLVVYEYACHRQIKRFFGRHHESTASDSSMQRGHNE
jgi:hypothetical protein